MCVFSYTNNYIFFHIPKCGGTSMYQVLPKMDKVEGIKDTHVNYVKTKKVFDKIGKLEYFENAKKFSIIRNPIDRTISLYRYISEHTDHPLHKDVKKLNFTEFCLYLKYFKDDSITSCYEHLCDKNGVIDSSISIFKLEDINTHLNSISEIVNNQIDKMPHVNKSSHDFIMSDKSIEVIKEIFKKDFETFYQEIL